MEKKMKLSSRIHYVLLFLIAGSNALARNDNVQSGFATGIDLGVQGGGKGKLFQNDLFSKQVTENLSKLVDGLDFSERYKASAGVLSNLTFGYRFIPKDSRLFLGVELGAGLGGRKFSFARKAVFNHDIHMGQDTLAFKSKGNLSVNN